MTTCKDCGWPIHWSDEAAAWYHDSPAATFYCPGVGMVWPAETEFKLDGCTCSPIRGSHRPPCAWAA
jgi:hypothetical protein